MSKKCQNCGFELADNMNFCPQCHAKVEASSAATPQTPAAPTQMGNKKTIILIVSAIVGVVVVALVAWIVIGSGKSSKPDAQTSAKADAKGEDAAYLAVVKKWMKEYGDEEGASNFRYEKTKKVSPNYVVVCGYADLARKGTNRRVGFSLKKKDGVWEMVEFEDNWEPKDKYK